MKKTLIAYTSGAAAIMLCIGFSLVLNDTKYMSPAKVVSSTKIYNNKYLNFYITALHKGDTETITKEVTPTEYFRFKPGSTIMLDKFRPNYISISYVLLSYFLLVLMIICISFFIKYNFD